MVKNTTHRVLFKQILLLLLGFMAFPICGTSQTKDNFFYSLLDSLQDSPLAEWAQFEEKSLKSTRAYFVSKKSNLKMLSEAGLPSPTEEEINFFISSLMKKRKATAALFAMAQENFKITEPRLAEEKLPAVFKYLPIALSAMNPKAEWGGGAGIWHLYLPKAVKSGLKVSVDYDERLDAGKASQAAIRQLKTIHAQTKGNASETIFVYVFGKSYKKQVFTEPQYSPETLLHTLACVAYIFETKTLQPFHEAALIAPEFKEFSATKDFAINFRNTKYDFNAGRIGCLNPIFTSGHIRAGEIIKVPLSELEAFSAWFMESDNKVELEEKPAKISHKVKSGESLGLIASKYNVAIAEIKEWNKLKSDMIRAGQVLVIYMKNK
jgi:membrane-bound lytic murein transglycosylase D